MWARFSANNKKQLLNYLLIGKVCDAKNTVIIFDDAIQSTYAVHLTLPIES